jgi:hypothetical protein
LATINIGNLTFTHKGDYASGTTYAKNDVVYYSTNGNAYIAKQATTGNAPTSTAHWDVFAQGSGGIWSGALSLGSANQSVRVNSGGNALEFYTPSGGGILQMKQIDYRTTIDFNNANYNYLNSNFKVDITPTAADSKFLLMACLTIGFSNHDCGCSFGFMDSQVGSGDNNVIPTIAGSSGSRYAGSIGGTGSYAAQSDVENYLTTTVNLSTMYTPAAQNTNQRTFYVSSKRNSYNGSMHLNYGQNNHSLSNNSVSTITVMEVANSIT